jgi:hypothetical protein
MSYDCHRLADIFGKYSELPISLRSVSECKVKELKDEAYRKIITLRNNNQDEEDAAAKEKKIKFMTFIINLQVKTALRKWKEEVFGQKG